MSAISKELEKAIETVLGEVVRHDDAVYGEPCICGRERYPHTHINRFETTFADELFRALSARPSMRPVGWEACYPPWMRGWARCKVDLALGLLNPSDSTAIPPLFEAAVEVKIAHHPHDFWAKTYSSAFKLLGYCGASQKDGWQERIGKEKYVVVFYDKLPVHTEVQAIDGDPPRLSRFIGGAAIEPLEAWLRNVENWGEEDIGLVRTSLEAAVRQDRVLVLVGVYDAALVKPNCRGYRPLRAALLRVGLE